MICFACSAVLNDRACSPCHSPSLYLIRFAEWCVKVPGLGELLAREDVFHQALPTDPDMILTVFPSPHHRASRTVRRHHLPILGEYVVGWNESGMFCAVPNDRACSPSLPACIYIGLAEECVKVPRLGELSAERE